MIASYPDSIHEKEINRLIKFYRSRLYLKDSEFEILSDIADDAEKMLTYLEAEKEALIDAFKQNHVAQDPSKMRGFALYNARYSSLEIG